ncbi:MAG: serine hydrolase [Deltaproteobacteria bacterium]|nr:serine hydrolase [Deltaproteobacteria bacterium]
MAAIGELSGELNVGSGVTIGDATRDADAVNLSSAARLVVEEHRAAPCAVVGAAQRSAGRWRLGWGAAGRLWSVPAGQAPPAHIQLLFDLASLTKPVTALTLARCQREGLVDRAQPLGELLPELGDTASGRVPLDLLAAHRAGLEAHREFFTARTGAEQPSVAAVLAEAADARRPECGGAPPAEGFPPVYSDLGYILVGAALASRAGRELDALVQDQVARPLGLTLGSARQLLRSEPNTAQRLVPTEEVGWRGGVLRGVVHDENAWVLADRGSAGHAGMFGDIWSVVRLGTKVLDGLSGRRDDWLTATELEPLIRRRPGGSHCAGFDRRGSEAPMSGRHFGPETFGHLGFTGTSLWIDPDQQLVGVLLTNRVHPTRDSTAIRTARPAAYDRIHERMTA